MDVINNFRPNLIPNNPKDGSLDFDKIIQKNGGYKEYLILPKKDGCRLELLDGQVLSRALKVPGSKLVVERFKALAEHLKLHNIMVEGEFYKHGEKFNSIFRFFSKEDVTCPKYRIQLEKEKAKNPRKFYLDYEGKSIDFLTTFHNDLEFHLFDGILLDRPEITGFEERMFLIKLRMKDFSKELLEFVKFPSARIVHSKEELEMTFNATLDLDYEGLVMVHYNHSYKFGRNSLSQGTLLKMKNDAIEYDAVILDILEATSIKEGVETTTNELGRSVTSKKKDDRELSGLAKGFLVKFADLGTFTVGLRSFDNEAKKELLENKENYIGKHFKYTAMEPVKDFPRHAYFDCWRDEK